MKFLKQWLTPDDAFRFIGYATTANIKFNPELNMRNGANWEIVLAVEHDGTGFFTQELVWDAICLLSEKLIQGVVMEVGPISLATVYGTVNLPAGRFPGEVQRIRIPVRLADK